MKAWAQGDFDTVGPKKSPTPAFDTSQSNTFIRTLAQQVAKLDIPALQTSLVQISQMPDSHRVMIGRLFVHHSLHNLDSWLANGGPLGSLAEQLPDIVCLSQMIMLAFDAIPGLLNDKTLEAFSKHLTSSFTQILLEFIFLGPRILQCFGFVVVFFVNYIAKKNLSVWDYFDLPFWRYLFDIICFVVFGPEEQAMDESIPVCCYILCECLPLIGSPLVRPLSYPNLC